MSRFSWKLNVIDVRKKQDQLLRVSEKVAFIKTKRLDKGLVTLESNGIVLIPFRYLWLSYRLEAMWFDFVKMAECRREATFEVLEPIINKGLVNGFFHWKTYCQEALWLFLSYGVFRFAPLVSNY